jgi:CheY-like chemotaxis protein
VATHQGSNADGAAAGVTGLVKRILVIDDNAAIHSDFRKLLCPVPTGRSLDETEAALFDQPLAEAPVQSGFVIDSAFQGRDGLEKVKRALLMGRPYALAFVDMRMPPGWDGVETIANIWKVDPNLEVVVCSAYCDYSWNDMMKRLARPDRVRLLLKPFSSKDAIEIAWERTNCWLARQRRKDTPDR